MRTLLIDGDTLIYEAASAHEYEAQWNEWLWTLHADLNAGIEHLKGSITEICKGLGTDKLVIALSDEKRWRPAVMPEYKSHRRKTRKPITYGPLREYCKEVWSVFQRDSLEGDDVLGILATHPTLIKGEKVVVSIDKDLLTIPGNHLNYSKAREAGDYNIQRVVSEGEADYNHLFQTLTGDRSDGYPGCPGIGPVKAEEILMPFFHERDGGDVVGAWEAVVAAFAKKNLGEEVALQNARVARICRYTDYDFKKKEVRLWNPPANAI